MQAVSHHLLLPKSLYVEVAPARFKNTRLIFQNLEWARRLDMTNVLTTDHDWHQHFVQFTPLTGSLPTPLALCYHGHQFGVYNPELGDGRGFLYAQVIDPKTARVLDLATKGSGQTPFSRQGDGRLTLKGAVRELLATSMLDALGVATSHTFAIAETDESLQRSDEPSPTRAAVLVRLSHSHIRLGSFQRLAYLKDNASLEALIRHTLTYYCPTPATPAETKTIASMPIGEASATLLNHAISNIARLTALWMAAGFVHGVLNTDNYNITGESFDYGPWRFLPSLTPNFTAAYFDQHGRYCYGRQPEAGLWALSRLAECLLPFVAGDRLNAQLQTYQSKLDTALTYAVCHRLGIAGEWDEASAFVRDFLTALSESASKDESNFETAFFDWYGAGHDPNRPHASPRHKFYATPAFAKLGDRLKNAPLLPHTAHALAHPYFAGDHPETMLIDEVEALWQPIADKDDWQPLAKKLTAIRHMKAALCLAQTPTKTAIPAAADKHKQTAAARLLGKDI